MWPIRSGRDVHRRGDLGPPVSATRPRGPRTASERHPFKEFTVRKLRACRISIVAIPRLALAVLLGLSSTKSYPDQEKTSAKDRKPAVHASPAKNAPKGPSTRAAKASRSAGKAGSAPAATSSAGGHSAAKSNQHDGGTGKRSSTRAAGKPEKAPKMKSRSRTGDEWGSTGKASRKDRGSQVSS